MQSRPRQRGRACLCAQHQTQLDRGQPPESVWRQMQSAQPNPQQRRPIHRRHASPGTAKARANNVAATRAASIGPPSISTQRKVSALPFHPPRPTQIRGASTFNLGAHPFRPGAGLARPAPAHDNPGFPDTFRRQLMRQCPEFKQPWQRQQGVLAKATQKGVNLLRRRGGEPVCARPHRARRPCRGWWFRHSLQLACGLFQLLPFHP